MIDAAQLTTDLKRLVLAIENDLRARVDGPDRDLRQEGAEQAWRDEYDRAREAGRTARTWTEWRDDRVTQAAVAWVLTTVFVRFCEDNRLLEPVWISGPRERRQEAHDARTAYFQQHPLHTDREWLLQPIEHLRSVPATKDLVESHSALWTVAPSARAAEAILAFWHEQDADGELRRDFTDPELSTRFLGDLYQDLSEHAKDTYALLQTPEFVEEFILDRTLEPALKERPLEGFKLIDPTCGSGHFLLGAFSRFFAKWRDLEPNTNSAELAGRALASVCGVDLNPFAVAIARFRLIIAALHACGETSLENAPGWDVQVTAGDSLLDWENFLPGDTLSFSYATEDPKTLAAYLRSSSYDVVVGNPPYITVKDKALNAKYRELYSACKGTYALTVPFMQRFFSLARRGSEAQPAGWVGQITSNSFMKREFGSKLIEEFLPRKDLRLVVDTSGAYIPGHGTPTVILVGRDQPPTSQTVRAVLGIRGEPGRPEEAGQGLVWRSIVDYVDVSEHEDAYTSTADLPRRTLSAHPWSLTGGGANQLLRVIEATEARLEGAIAPPIGGSIRAGADDAFMRPLGWTPNSQRNGDRLRPLVMGDITRDWSITPDTTIFFPYQYRTGDRYEGGLARELWPWRAQLAARGTFQGVMADAGLKWWEYMQFTKAPYRTPLSIAFAFVATHNHFVLDRGGKVFNRSAPVIKLPEGASEDEHLALLGVLNSSTACFWLKQNSHNKGSTVDSKGARQTLAPWEDFYEFTGTTLKDFPLPSELPLERARRLDEMARTLPTYLSSAVPERGRPHPPLIPDPPVMIRHR
ncbi:BREX-2 system adenine-specific DNA-methyltransferase PglX [Agilicoccus flavus]|uniref:BREX-2 system adenine-specific DNA-methyltransferase PglX n=1 Tax=Agilicoccus flavus TaxID=2775968 RepID=UPI001CF67F57|nr:BREX-2 system adenine-specific DNA-methyltransferase PglX [Agilicoccus flavus]